MEEYALFAEALRYPAPGRLESLQAGLAKMTSGETKKKFARFVGRLQDLSLGEWEELYTRTLDLNPAVAPYVGYQIWGENYQRGGFLAQMSRGLQEAGVDPDGELPDHLIPVLRYLDIAPTGMPELAQTVETATQKMIKQLHRTEPGNPYIYLLEAVSQTVGEQTISYT